MESNAQHTSAKIDLTPLESAISRFATTIAGIQDDLHHEATRFQTAHSALSERLAELGDDPRSIISRSTRAYALDLTVPFEAPQRPIFLSGRELSNKDILEDYVQKLNRRACWLLVDAYEAFVRFARHLYATAGKLDHTLWKPYHSKHPSDDLSRQPLAWFEEKSQKIRLSEIIDSLRSHFTAIQTHDNPPYMPNPLFWLHLTWQLRNAVVHSQGRVQPSHITASLTRVMQKAGRRMLTHATYEIPKHLKDLNGELVVWLIDESPLNRGSYHFITCPCRDLIERVASHACLMYGSVTFAFGAVPYWMRTDQKHPGM